MADANTNTVVDLSRASVTRRNRRDVRRTDEARIHDGRRYTPGRGRPRPARLVFDVGIAPDRNGESYIFHISQNRPTVPEGGGPPAESAQKRKTARNRLELRTPDLTMGPGPCPAAFNTGRSYLGDRSRGWGCAHVSRASMGLAHLSRAASSLPPDAPGMISIRSRPSGSASLARPTTTPRCITRPRLDASGAQPRSGSVRATSPHRTCGEGRAPW